MGEFMGRVRVLVAGFGVMDHYGVLEVLRKHEFFSDVAGCISTHLHGIVAELQAELRGREDKIERL